MTIDSLESVIAPGTWAVDPVHSTVGFAVKHMVVSTFRGRFERYDAMIESDGERSTLRGSVDVTSIEVKDADLAAHLQAPDFFDSQRHGELRFVSTAIRRFGDEIEVDGDLTIKGITRAVTARGSVSGPAEDPYGSQRLGLELEAVIDRRAHGMEFNMPLPRGGFALGNDVKLLVNLEFTKVA